MEQDNLLKCDRIHKRDILTEKYVFGREGGGEMLDLEEVEARDGARAA